MGDVRQHFRPEFLNRVDEVILFERLRRDQMADIVDIQMHRLEELAAARGLKVQLDTAARDWLAERGYDPVYGARPLKRTIQKHVQDALADKILAGDIEDGSLVLISEKKGDLVVSSQANAEPVH